MKIIGLVDTPPVGPTAAVDPLVEPELRGDLPRKVTHSLQTRRVRAFAWCLLPTALCLAYSLLSPNIRHIDRLFVHGVQGTAHVTSKTMTAWRPTGYFLRFEFSAPTRTGLVRGTERVSKRRFDDTSVGDSVPIMFNPEDPREYEQSVITEAQVNQVRFRNIGVTILLVIVYVCGLLVMEAELAGSRHLLRDGVALVATVAGHRTIQRKHIAYVLYCQYRMPTDSRLRSFEVKVDNALFVECRYGDKFTVLLLPDSDAAPFPYFRLQSAEVEGMPREAAMPYRRT